MMLNTIQRANAKTLFTTVSHKRHNILHSPLWTSHGAPPVRPLEKSYRTQHQRCGKPHHHYSDVIMDAMPSEITLIIPLMYIYIYVYIYILQHKYSNFIYCYFHFSNNFKLTWVRCISISYIDTILNFVCINFLPVPQPSLKL